MKFSNVMIRALVLVLAFVMCEGPQALAQQAQTPDPQQTQSTDAQQQTPQTNRGTTVDPSAAPLAPSQPQSLPDAPSATGQQDQTAQPQTQMTQRPTPPPPAPAPVGAAAAEGIRTAGNAASKPAGAAIAPAKQGQMRSLLIKLGAVAAAGVAIGTVYALSRGTSSTPPNVR